ncbi:MAG: NUDIX domain-containing protein [archaeon]|nr:NUDIX domain-containing protein [archaeon]
MKNIKIEDYYKMALETSIVFKKENPTFVRSVFIYGSVSRGEAMPKVSDLDIMVVLKKDYLSKEEACILNKINRQVSKNYSISMTFRIRSNQDITEKYPFPDDFGPIAMLDYVRDAWYIYGEDLTNVFLERLKNQAKYVEDDLKLFFINLRKILRATISISDFHKTIATNENVTNNLKPINYHLGDILGHFARCICLSKGISYLTESEALGKAYEITKCELFLEARLIKASKKNVNHADSVQILEQLLNKFLYNEKCEAKEYIENLKLEKRLSAGVLCAVNEKFLILKRNFAGTYWTIPKGGVNENENIMETAKRELKEETGLTIPNLFDCKISTYHSYFKNNSLIIKTKTNIFFGTPDSKKIVLSDEHSDYKWAKSNEYLELNNYPMSYWIALCFKRRSTLV